MGKKKVNPRRIPLGKAAIDTHRIIQDAMKEEMRHAWYLVVSALLETELAKPEKIPDLADECNRYFRTANAVMSKLGHAEEITGRKRPARLDANHIKSQVDLDRFRKNVEKMALHTSLCVFCLGLEKRFSSEELKRRFLVEYLTEAEIDSGRLDYKELELQLESKNIQIGLDPEAPLPLFSI